MTIRNLRIIRLSAELHDSSKRTAAVTTVNFQITPTGRRVDEVRITSLLTGFLNNPAADDEKVYEASITCILNALGATHRGEGEEEYRARITQTVWPHVRQSLVDQVNKLGCTVELPFVLGQPDPQ